MSFGDRSRSCSPATPSRRAVPGRNDSTTTSAVSTSWWSYAALAGIEQIVVDAAPIENRRQLPHRIATAGIFDLDDVRAKLREHQGRERARQQPRQIDDAYPGQWRLTPVSRGLTPRL